MTGGADLHLHSTASDGGLSPSAVMDAAAAAGLGAVALTDHDSVEGVREAAERASELGLAFAAGVELTAYEGRSELHVLGLFLDPESDALSALFAELKRARAERSGTIAAKLRELGLEITGEEINALAEGVAGRMHVARVLVARGHVDSIPEAFARYIGDDGPGYVEKRRLSPAEVIEAIRSAGGVAALAHPGLANRDELIPELVGSGMQALEVYYPRHGRRQTEHYRRLAAKHGLAETGGSDFHGEFKRDVEIGVPHVPLEAFERLEELARARA